MPSRFAAFVIVLFWLGTTAYLGYTRVWPWWSASAAPAVSVSATDEASRVKVRWRVQFKSGTGPFQKAGHLTTELKADDTDTYTFVAQYSDIKLSLLGVTVRVPKATTEVTIDRDGHLRKQSMTGSGVFVIPLVGEVSGSGSVTSHVAGGVLRGRAEGSVLGLTLDPTDLPPVPVPSGQVLNPLLPVNRLTGVTPGRRWTIRQVDPLGDSLKQLLQAVMAKNGVGAKMLGGRADDGELLAEVLPDLDAIAVRRNEETVPCRVIEYRGSDNKVAARTWVSAADGRVMRQEARADGSTLRLDRDE